MKVDFYNILENKILKSFIESFIKNFSIDNYPVLNFDFDFLINKEAISTAEYIKNNFSTLIIIGMGGAVLNPYMITAAKNNGNIIIIDTLDSFIIEKKLQNVDFKKAAILSISKSGKTIETLILTKFFINEFLKQGLLPSNHFYAITSYDTPLFNIMSEADASILEHHPEIGGRFSGITSVGFIPAIFLGIDFSIIVKKLNFLLKGFINNPIKSNIYSSLSFLLKKSNLVLFSYSYFLSNFTKWYAQIIAECSGKNLKGITPIHADGPLDHHSQLQLYLEGPADKCFSLYLCKNNFLSSNKFDLSVVNSILIKEYEILFHLLNKSQFPLRTVIIEKYNEDIIAELMFNAVVEIILYCNFNYIDPFTQPAVDKIKYDSLKKILM